MIPSSTSSPRARKLAIIPAIAPSFLSETSWTLAGLVVLDGLAVLVDVDGSGAGTGACVDSRGSGVGADARMNRSGSDDEDNEDSEDPSTEVFGDPETSGGSNAPHIIAAVEDFAEGSGLSDIPSVSSSKRGGDFCPLESSVVLGDPGGVTGSVIFTGSDAMGRGGGPIEPGRGGSPIGARGAGSLVEPGHSGGPIEPGGGGGPIEPGRGGGPIEPECGGGPIEPGGGGGSIDPGGAGSPPTFLGGRRASSILLSSARSFRVSLDARLKDFGGRRRWDTMDRGGTGGVRSNLRCDLTDGRCDPGQKCDPGHRFTGLLHGV